MAALKDLKGIACPVHPGAIIKIAGEKGICSGGDYTNSPQCKTETLTKLAISLNGHLIKADDWGRYPRTADAFKADLFQVADIILRDPASQYSTKHVPAVALLDTLIEDMVRTVYALKFTKPPDDLTQTDVQEECEKVARIALGEWAGNIDIDAALPATQNGKAVPAAAKSLIVWEDYDEALIANAAYLQRQPVVENLLYTESISLIVGGKHAGKSTIARTAALCIAKGLPFLDRQTLQGHVIYAASDDEVMTARMELLRMGWNQKKDPLALVHVKTEQGVMVDPQAVLDEIANRAREVKAVFIVLDMLFDYAGIRDEMSYAGTREAAGRIQVLANQSGAHALATHHSPKHLPDIATAATAALGSQGIAARFSPIILARHWGADLYTVESTAARDPRGVALPQTCVGVDRDGRTETRGAFKDWMKWQLYAPRIMGMIEGGEPGKEYSVDAVAREFEIPRPQAQNALYQLWKAGTLQREKKGRGYRYWKMIEREDLVQTELSETNPSWRGGGD